MKLSCAGTELLIGHSGNSFSEIILMCWIPSPSRERLCCTVTICTRSVLVVTTGLWLWRLRHTSVSLYQVIRYQVEPIETERLFTLGIKWSDNKWKALYRCEHHHYALRMHLRSDLFPACNQQRVHTCVQSHTEGPTCMKVFTGLKY